MDLMFDILVAIGSISYVLRFFTMLSGYKATEPAPLPAHPFPEHPPAQESEIQTGC
jgi:hypothetical protein